MKIDIILIILPSTKSLECVEELSLFYASLLMVNIFILHSG